MAELSIIIPTFNERDNIELLIQKIASALLGVDWEIIFVDDNSPDGTAELIARLSQTNTRVKCIKRIGWRGLSSACIAGMNEARAPYLAVMDADLQHDETILRPMFELLKTQNLDVVVGSRYVKGGQIANWSRLRVAMSRMATWVGKVALRIELNDPLSGFFMVQSEFFHRVSHRLSGKGFKILLDLCASSDRKVKLKEVPYTFRPRHKGKSKLKLNVIWDYISLILDKFIGRYIPVKIFWILVGGIILAGIIFFNAR